MLHLKIITPEKAVYESDISQITCNTVDGEITILSHHAPLLTLLADGVITVVNNGVQEFFSAGSGYVETDGKVVRILISHARGQQELDEKTIEEVKERAEQLLREKPQKADREKAFAMLRRASVELKVLGKMRKKR